MASTTCHSPSSGAWANNGQISSHAKNNARAPSPSGAAEERSRTPVRAHYGTCCTAVVFSLGRSPRRASMKAS